MKFFPSFANWRSGILQTLTRFPWNILCGVTGASCAIVSLHFSKNEVLVGQSVRLAMTVALGMPFFFVADAARTPGTIMPLANRNHRCGPLGVVVFCATAPAVRWAGYHLDSVAAAFGGITFFRRRLGIPLAAGEFRFLAV